MPDQNPPGSKASVPLPTFVNTLIIGAGIGGLLAARNAAKTLKGNKENPAVLLIEERGQVGGLVAPGTIGGYTFDIGAESFATRGSQAMELCKELGLEIDYPRGSSWLYDKGQCVPLPQGTFGIPTSVKDPIFVKALLTLRGQAAVERAEEDLNLSPRVGADSQTLAELVSSRLGTDTLEALVGPFASAIHGANPEKLPLKNVTPMLLETMVTQGSLTKAVEVMRKNKPPVAQTRGGMYRLTRALAKDLIENGGQVNVHVKAIHIVAGVQEGQPRFTVWVKHARSNPNPAGPPVPHGSAIPIGCQNLIIATDPRTAQPLLRSAVGSAVRLSFHEKRAGKTPTQIFSDQSLDTLGQVLTELEFPPAVPVQHHTLVVKCPQLNDHPRGSGVLVTPASKQQIGPVKAKALTHYNSKWPQACQPELQEDVHILRVSYGRDSDAEDAEKDSTLQNTEIEPMQTSVETALADASAILGVQLSEENLLAHRYISWGTSLRPPTGKLAKQIEHIRSEVEKTPGLFLTGAWVAGTGIAAVIKHAQNINVTGQ